MPTNASVRATVPAGSYAYSASPAFARIAAVCGTIVSVSSTPPVAARVAK